MNAFQKERREKRRALRAQTRRAFLRNFGMATTAVAAAMPAALVAQTVPERRPNILLILVDDLGYGDLSSYGAPDLKSPNIDRLMADGMRFDKFYANCPVCSPTRAAVMTGRYPDLVGVPGVIRTHRNNNYGQLSPQAILLPAVLKSAGYHTAIVGKWHLGLTAPDWPNERGFDHFHGYLGDMMDDYYTHRRHNINYMRLDRKEIDPKGHATDLFSQWASDYVRERADKPNPFFLYLAYNAPHTPIQPPQEWVDRVAKRETGIDAQRARLVALIEHMDEGIGRVMKTLRETGADKNTLVIFTSDNGGQINVGANNGGLRAGKQDMYEGGIREPMCAVWPGKIAPGSRQAERLALTMDLFPTVCEAAGAKFHHEIDGRSFLPTLLGQTQPPEDRILFWVRREGGRLYGGRAYYAAREGDWKLVQNSPFEPYQLFNLKEDPKEEHPLAENHKMYQRLFNALHDHVLESGMTPWQRAK